MTFYMREFRKGNLQVLCHDCNSRKGANLEGRYRPVLLASDLLRDGGPHHVEPAEVREQLGVENRGRP